MIIDIIHTMRPKQWYKNIVLFIGIIFSVNFFNFHMWVIAISAFIIFCCLSGCQYIINDILDKEKDKLHPRKSKRPIASGKLNVYLVLGFAIGLSIGALYEAYKINISFLSVSLSYFILTLSYSKILKHIPIVDVLTISSGFVLRAAAGCFAINVLVSPWLIICAFFVALFLALGKRKHELVLLKDNAIGHRDALNGFTVESLNQMITIVTGALVMSYTLYTFHTPNTWMMATIPIVIYGLFRYVLLTDSGNMGGEPELLFRDKGIIICVILWLVISVVLTMWYHEIRL